jgi:GWxTD domain-containing protein
MKYFYLLTVFLFFGYSIRAQVEYSQTSKENIEAHMFSVDVANYQSAEEGKTEVSFFVKVPYAEIQFSKKKDQFCANYNITLTFYNKDKDNILSERTWKEQVFEKEFDRTISRSNYNLSFRSYDMTPGEYVFKCIVEDLDSRKTLFKEFPFTVKKILDLPGLSDIILISEIRPDSTGETVIPNISKVVTNKTDSLEFYYDIYSNNNQNVLVEYYLHDIKADQTTKVLDPQKLKPGRNTIFHTLHNMKFKLGEYSLKAVLEDNNWKRIDSVEKKFFSKIEGMPNSITDLDKAVEQLLYIASPSELDFISDTENYNERLERFLAFWETKKPNAKMEDNPVLYEYYRRIEYANKNFKGMVDGWRSDMGMIFVTFGPPNNVERHPFEADSKPYEIWEYNELNRYFVFVDRTGFGDYYLYNPDYSRWPGYRY